MKDDGSSRAIDGISFEIESGEVYGLLGENGAGKSTAFISNTFVPMDESGTPGWIDVVSSILPLRPFVETMQDAFNPTVDAPAFNWANLAVLLAWGGVGTLLAWRCFKWEPVTDVARRGAPGRQRRGRQRGRPPSQQLGRPDTAGD